MEFNNIIRFNTKCDLSLDGYNHIGFIEQNDNTFNDVVKRAMELKAIMITKIPPKPYSKKSTYRISYNNNKPRNISYDEVKKNLNDNIQNEKYLDCKTWLIDSDNVVKDEVMDLSYKQFINTNFSYSKIKEFIITDKKGEIITNKNSYNNTLIEVWKKMPIQKIVQNSSFNIKLGNFSEEGYIYNKNLKFSYQCGKANYTVKEIFNMANVCKYKIYAVIELNDKQNTIIRYTN
jgi:hypothetical protein